MHSRIAYLLIFCASIFCGIEVLTAEVQPTKSSNGDLSLAIESKQGDAADQVHLKIETGKIKKSSVFVLENPPRIVVDLFGPKAAKNSETQVHDQIVSRVRIGVHTDKSRLVVDIKGDKVPPYSWTESDTGAVLKINFALQQGDTELVPPPVEVTAAANVSPPKLDTPPASITPVAVISVEPSGETDIDEIVPRSPVPTATITPTVAPTLTPTIVPTEPPQPTAAPTTTAAPVESSGTTALEITPVASVESPPESKNIAADEIGALEFGYSGEGRGSPTIKLRLGSKSEFELKKVDEKTYKLQVPNMHVTRAALKLPQFPPHDFVGFNVVLLRQFDRGVEVTIGVERGVRISVAPNGDEIWIKVIGEPRTLTQSPPNMLGQGKK